MSAIYWYHCMNFVFYTDPQKSKFEHDSSPSGHEDNATQSSDGDYLPESPPRSPVEFKEELPPYLPAISGCRNVEEFVCLNKIEEGTYGVVYRAKEKRNGKKNKYIRDLFPNKLHSLISKLYPNSHCSNYSLISFDERVNFWLQRIWWLPCACVYIDCIIRA